MGQDFSFGLGVLAEVSKVSRSSLHLDVEAICKAYEAMKPLAKRFGIKPPVPRIAAFCYAHLAALGCEVVYSENGELTVRPLVNAPQEIDGLKEPKDYLQSDVIQQRIKICEELRRRYPQSPKFIGHPLEGPITTAVMIMGQDFLTLPYDDPEKAHKLLDFCTKSALNYANTIDEYFGGDVIQIGHNGFPDDFAGMFPPALFQEFVVPYWERIFQGLKAPERSIHSELLRVEHLPFLKELKVEDFDPGADQYLSPELLQKHCPCKFQSRILAWQIRDLSAEELEALYIKIASFKPHTIGFGLPRLEDEPKIQHLLQVARRLKGE